MKHKRNFLKLKHKIYQQKQASENHWNKLEKTKIPMADFKISMNGLNGLKMGRNRVIKISNLKKLHKMQDEETNR